jgi:hypothetical protein
MQFHCEANTKFLDFFWFFLMNILFLAKNYDLILFCPTTRFVSNRICVEYDSDTTWISWLIHHKRHDADSKLVPQVFFILTQPTHFRVSSKICVVSTVHDYLNVQKWPNTLYIEICLFWYYWSENLSHPTLAYLLIAIKVLSKHHYLHWTDCR